MNIVSSDEQVILTTKTDARHGVGAGEDSCEDTAVHGRLARPGLQPHNSIGRIIETQIFSKDRSYIHHMYIFISKIFIGTDKGKLFTVFLTRK